MPNSGSPAHHMLDRDELKALMQEALREVIPDAMRKEFELVGLDATAPETRAEIRKDMEMIRKLRTGWESAATKIGGAILMAAFAGVLALIAFGKAKIGP